MLTFMTAVAVVFLLIKSLLANIQTEVNLPAIFSDTTLKIPQEGYFDKGIWLVGCCLDFGTCFFLNAGQNKLTVDSNCGCICWMDL